MGSRPEQRLLRTPQDAEESASAWMRYMGFHDVRLTPDGPDGGVDVTSAEALAQVKAELKPTGRPAIQQLSGIAHHEGTEALFFSLGGFTNEALQWGSEAGVALFTFDLTGDVTPLNQRAKRMLDSATDAAEAPPQALSDKLLQQIDEWFSVDYRPENLLLLMCDQSDSPRNSLGFCSIAVTVDWRDETGRGGGVAARHVRTWVFLMGFDENDLTQAGLTHRKGAPSRNTVLSAGVFVRGESADTWRAEWPGRPPAHQIRRMIVTLADWTWRPLSEWQIMG